MDAKQACDKLNGFNFQNRYLVGMLTHFLRPHIKMAPKERFLSDLNSPLVLYHQPEKMARSREDLAERQENLERLKQQHGIE
jgi:pre-mRNA branch site protein p14